MVRTAATPGVQTAPRLLCISCLCDSLYDDGYQERRLPELRCIDARTVGQIKTPGPGTVSFFEHYRHIKNRESLQRKRSQDIFGPASTLAASLTAVSPVFLSGFLDFGSFYFSSGVEDPVRSLFPGPVVLLGSQLALSAPDSLQSQVSDIRWLARLACSTDVQPLITPITR